MTQSRKSDALAKAEALLAQTPLIDGHNDLPYVIRVDAVAKGDVAAFRLEEDGNGRDTDIPKLKRGRVAGQFFAAYVPPREPRPASYALQQIALVQNMNALHADVFLPATRAGDVARAKRQGKIASFVTVENGAAIEDRLDVLAAFHALGVRLMTLCHNSTTSWCDSATDAPQHGGLSPFGKTVIAEMNRLGMMIDLAHVSDDVMRQAIELSRAPVVFSHSNARALSSHRRNVPDDVLQRVPANGGIVMATFVPDFISQKSLDWMAPMKDAFDKTRDDVDMNKAVPAREREIGPWPRGSLQGFCDQLDYLAKTIGHDHIGIGSDFYGGPQGPGLENAGCFPGIFAELIRRGWSAPNLRKLASGNFLRVFRAVEKAAERRGKRSA